MISFSPNVNFLSLVVAFEAAIIAIAIPLSFNIVSRISERYQSEVLVKKFFKEWEIKCLPLFLIINILTVIILRFFVSDKPDSCEWNIAAWIILVFFIVCIFVLWRFFNKMKRYTTDTGYLLGRLFDDTEKIFK